MANNIVANLVLGAKYDKQSVNKATKEYIKVKTDIQNELNDIKFSDSMLEELEKALGIINKSFKNVNLTKFFRDLNNGLISNKDNAKELAVVISGFLDDMETLKIASRGTENIFNNLDTKQLEKVIQLQKEVYENEEKLNNIKETARQKAQKVKERKPKSVNSLLNEYEGREKNNVKQQSSKAEIKAIYEQIGSQQALRQGLEDNINKYRELIDLFIIMSNESKNIDPGSEKAIENAKNLSQIYQQIVKMETSLTSEGGILGSKTKKAENVTAYRESLQIKDFESYGNENVINKAVTNFINTSVNAAETALQTSMNVVWNTIQQMVKANIEKMQGELDKFEEKNKERQRKQFKDGNEIDSGAGTGNGIGNGTGKGDDSGTGAGTDVVSEKDIAIMDEYAKSTDYCITKIKELEEAKGKLPETDAGEKKYFELYDEQLKYFAGLQKLGMQAGDIKKSLNNEDLFNELSESINFLEDFDQEVQDVIKTIQNFKKQSGSDGQDNGNPLGLDKEDIEKLKELLGGLFNGITPEDKEAIINTFKEIASSFETEMKSALNNFIDELNNMDDREWTFDNLRNSLLDIVDQFKNSLTTVNLTSTQLDEAYKMIKGWNDASRITKRETTNPDNERSAFFNSSNGSTSNSFGYDKETSFSQSLNKALARISIGLENELGQVYDTWVHSHPLQKSIKGIATKGTDIGFSLDDLNVMLKNFITQGVKKMMVTSNYKFTQLDLTDVSEDKFKEIVKYFEEELRKAGIEIENGSEKIDSKFISEKVDGRDILNLDTKSSLLTGFLNNAIKKAGLDSSKMISTGNIDDLSVDMDRLQKEEKDAKINAEELLTVLRSIADTLKEINENGFNLSKSVPSSDIDEIRADKSIQGQQELQQELDETDKKVQKIAYHWGEVNTENIGKKKAEPFNKMIDNYTSGMRATGEPWGSFGSGTYITSNPNEFKGMDASDKPFAKFIEIDLSKLKMYETKTTEHAQQLYNFLTKFQQEIIAFGSGYDYQGTIDIDKIDLDALFKDFQSIFKNVNISEEEFNNFVDQMVELVNKADIKQDGRMSPKANMLVGNDNIATRLMKALGYDGIDNSGTDFDSLQHGSVVFDLDISNVGKKFNSLDELLENTKEVANETTTAIDKVGKSNNSQDKLQSELKDTKKELDNVSKSANNTEKEIRDLDNTGKNLNPQSPSSSTTVQPQQPTTPSIEQIEAEKQVLKELEGVIQNVEIAIANKTKAIQAEEVQMDVSVNSEIAKLQELENKLVEIKNKFAEGIIGSNKKSNNIQQASDQNNSNDDELPFINLDVKLDKDEWRTRVREVVKELNPKLIKLDALIVDSEWIREIESVINKLTPQKIKLEVDPEVNLNANNKTPKNNSGNSNKGKNNALKGDTLTEVLSQSDTLYDEIYQAAKRANPELTDTVKIVQQLRRETDGSYKQSFRVTDDKGHSAVVGKNKDYLLGQNVVRDDIAEQKEQDKLSSKSYSKSTKWLKEIYDWQERIARLKEKNSKTQDTEIPLLEEKIKQNKKLMQTEEDRRKKEGLVSDKHQGKLDELELELKNTYKANRDAYNNSLQITINKLHEIALLENDKFDKDNFVKKQKEAYNELNAEIANYKKLKAQNIKDGKYANADNLEDEEKSLQRIYELDQKIAENRLFNLDEERKAHEKLEKIRRDSDIAVKKKADKENNKKSDKSSSTKRNGLDDIDNATRVKAIYNEQLKTLQKIKYLTDKQSTTGLDTNELKILESAKERLKTIDEAITAELGKQYDKSEKITEMINKIQNRGLKNDTTGEFTSDFTKVNLDGINSDKAVQEINDLISAVNKSEQEIKELQHLGDTDIFNDVFAEAKLEVEELNNKLLSGGFTKLKDYTDEISKVKNKLNSKKNTVAIVNPGDTKQAKIAMEKYFNEISDGKVKTKDLLNVNKTMTGTWVDQNNQVQKLTLSLDKLGNINKKFKLPTDKLGFFEDMTNRIVNKSKELAAYLVNFVGFYEVFNIIKQGLRYVTEFDSAMTELMKVSNDAESALKSFGKESFNIANQVGSTGTEITKAAADWERLGYNIKEASELAKNSAIYVNVGDGIDVDTATGDIVSAMKAFDIQAEDSIQIIDKYNEVGNNFAISSSGIGEAMSRSSAALAAAGNDINQAIALTTSMNEILQDPATVGQTLKTISLRLRGAKTEIEEMGESTDGMADSTSKLRKQVMALTNVDGTGGFDIMLNDKEFKSTYDIIEGIYQVWSKMDDIDQAALLELLAGKTRAQGMAALLSNFDVAQEALKSAQNSEGSALKENEAYMDSIQAKIEKLKNSWQQLWNSDLSREQLNPILEIAQGLLDIANNAGLAKSTLVAVGAAIGTIVAARKGGGRAK